MKAKLISQILILFTLQICFGQDIDSSDSKLNDNFSTPNVEKLDKQRRIETFQIVWQTINDNYFDEKFGGVNWNNIRTEFLPLVGNAKDDAELHMILQTMLDRMKRSHLAIIPPEVFVAIEEARAKSERLSREVTDKLAIKEDEESETPEDPEDSEENVFKKYGIGIDLRLLEGNFLITSIENNSTAQKAGLKTGYILEQVNGVSLKDFLKELRPETNTDTTFANKFAFELIETFLNGEKDTFVQVSVIDEINQFKTLNIKRGELKGDFVSLSKNLPVQYLNFEHKDLTEDIGYIKFNVFTLDVVENFCTAITDFQDKQVLIIDLRGNKGGLIGSVMGISSFLTQKPINLGTEINRKNRNKRVVDPHKKTFDGKTYILIDGQSYSAAEMFTAAMQENDLATVIGEKSAGEALPSLTRKLPTGAIFLFPVSNLETPLGNFLEGEGVKPNFEIDLDRTSLLGGNDRQLTKAIELSSKFIKIQKTKRKSSVNSEKPMSISVKKKPRKRTRRVRKLHQRKALNIIDKFIEKIGGKTELEKITSYKALGNLGVNRAGAVIEGELTISWVSPNKYVESYLIDGAGQITEIFDGENYYIESKFTGSDKVLSPQVLEDKSLSMGFYEILKMRELYSRILFRGTFEIDGQKVHLIEAISPNRLDVAFLFNANTNLLYKRTSNYSGDTYYENYQKVNENFLLPYSIRKGKLLSYNLNEIIVNAEIDESIFQRNENCFDKVD